ncbi:MAG: hypothetical protein M0036_01680, partial [Desulfobacteraceae bacterium]|nr:hypothetical protein [Desulfobacteraceae bacterium]
MKPIQRIVVNTLAILLLNMITGTGLADNAQEADLLPMIQRNCAPNGFEASPELYLVYYPDVLTSTNPDTAFACSHGFPWPEDT